jgi:hypothetical protein
VPGGPEKEQRSVPTSARFSPLSILAHAVRETSIGSIDLVIKTLTPWERTHRTSYDP